MKFVLLACSCLFFLSCSSLRTKDKLDKAPLQISKKLKKAKEQYSKKRYQQAAKILNNILKSHRNTDVGDEAVFLLAKTHSHLRNWKKALEFYKKTYDSKYQSSKEIQARIAAVKILTYKKNLYKKALSLIDRSLEIKTTPSQRAEFLEVRFTALVKTGSQLEAFETLVELSEKHPLASQRKSFKRKARVFLESSLSDPDLKDFADDPSSPSSPLKTDALYRYGVHLMDEGRYSKARRYLKKLIQNQPKGSISIQARQLLDQMDARAQVHPRTIGLILPLSGRYSNIGYQTLWGLQLALGIGEEKSQSLRLAIMDSRGKVEYARKGVKRLVEEDHTIAIVGGLLSKTAHSISIQAQQMGVPFIALSQKEGITDAGPFIFKNALTIDSQLDTLIQTAMDQLKFKNFAILYPNDPYGVKVSNLFWKKIKEKGGSIKGAQTYPPGETDFKESIQKLTGTFYPEDRKEEYRDRLRNWYRSQPKHQRRKTPPATLLPPVVDFDAIFIPDGPKALGQIAPMLAYNDVNNIHLMGTNLWNTNEFLRRGKNFISNSLFIDSFHGKDKKFTDSTFYKNYFNRFAQSPSAFSLLGYDSGLVIRSILRKKPKTRLDFGREILKNHGIPGVLNTLVLNKKREFIRPVVSLTVKKGEIIPLARQ